MTFKDKTFCASPNCKNACGRKMTDKQKMDLSMLSDADYWSTQVWYAYFCGEPENEYREDYVFSTRDEIIDAPIKYWQSLKNAELSTDMR